MNDKQRYYQAIRTSHIPTDEDMAFPNGYITAICESGDFRWAYQHGKDEETNHREIAEALMRALEWETTGWHMGWGMEYREKQAYFVRSDYERNNNGRL
jgi:hypothetical protein